MAYEAWLRRCDAVTALVTGGMMTDDFPAYDWRGAWAWGEDPWRAAVAAARSI